MTPPPADDELWPLPGPLGWLLAAGSWLLVFAGAASFVAFAYLLAETYSAIQWWPQ